MEIQDSFFLDVAITAEVIHPVLGKILIGEQLFSFFVIIRSQPVDRLTSQDFDRIAGVTTHQESAIVSHDFSLALGKQVHNQILIVIGVGNHGEIVVRVDFSQQTLDVSNFITINCEVGTHDRVFGGNCTKADRFLSNITIIMLFHPHDGGDCCSVVVAQQPSRRSLDCRFRRMLTAHREVTDHLPGRYIGTAGLFNPLVDYLTIAITDFSGNLSVPHGAGQQSLDSIHQPNEIGVSIRNLDLRNANLGARALGNRTNCQGQKTQLMQVSDLLVFISARTHGIGQNTIVFSNNLFNITIEEIVIETIDQIFVDKALQAEESQMVNIIQATHTGSVIGNHFGQTLRILLVMSSLIKVNQQKRIVIIHILSISFPLLYIYYIIFFYKNQKRPSELEGLYIT